MPEKLQRDARRKAFLRYLDELDALDPPSEEVRRQAARRAAEIRRRVAG